MEHTYKRTIPYTKQEAEIAFTQGTSEQIREALLGVTYSIEDWQWVQNACLALLKNADLLVQEIAILCLGHVATFHRRLNLAFVLPALQDHISYSKLTSALSRALEDIAIGTGDDPYFEENWAELPQKIKDTLIENRVFTNQGRYIKRHKNDNRCLINKN